jgi:hypothetical protein
MLSDDLIMNSFQTFRLAGEMRTAEGFQEKWFAVMKTGLTERTGHPNGFAGKFVLGILTGEAWVELCFSPKI